MAYSKVSQLGSVDAMPNVPIYDTFNRGSLGSNWTHTGSTATFTTDGQFLQIGGGDGTSYEQFIVYNRFLILNEFELSFNFIPATKTATSYGLSVVVRGLSENTFALNDVICNFNASTDATNGGTLDMVDRSRTTLLTSTYQHSTKLTFSVNDIIEFRLIRSFNTWTVKLTNLSLNNTDGNTLYTIQRTFNYLQKASSAGQPNIFKVGVGNIASSYQVMNFQVTTPARYIKTAFVGDSWIEGQNSGAVQCSVPYLVANGFARAAVFAGTGCTTNDIISASQDIVDVKPTYAYVQLGINDTFIVSASAWVARMQTLIPLIENSGVTKVIIGNIPPHNSADVSSYNTLLASTFSTYKIIDNFTLLKGAGTGINASYDSGDGLHLNTLGAKVQAEYIKSQAPELI